MPTKLCSALFGILYLFFGIMALFGAFIHLPPHRLTYYQMHILGNWGYLFSWMPVNPVHDLLYLAVGAGGLLAAGTFVTAVVYCRALFGLTAMLAIVGLLPFGADRVWGLIPLFGWNVMFHVVTAMLAYYYGFIYPLDLGGPEPASEEKY